MIFATPITDLALSAHFLLPLSQILLSRARLSLFLLPLSHIWLARVNFCHPYHRFCSCKLPEAFWDILGPSGASLELPGASWSFLILMRPGASWGILMPPEASCSLLGSWSILGPSGASLELPGPPGASRSFLILVRPGTSWGLLMPPEAS